MKSPTPAAPPSSFVNVLAWIMIAFSILGAATLLLQLAFVQVLLPAMPFDTRDVPEADMMFGVFRALVGLGFAFQLFLVYASWALLARRNWARRLFIVFFGLGAAWSVVTLVLLLAAVASIGFLALPGDMQGLPAEFQSLFRVMMAMFAVFSAGMIVLQVWVVKKLRSPAIKAEFVSTPA